MSKIKLEGRTLVWGTVQYTKEIYPKPEGRVKLRKRKNDFLRAYVRTDSGVSEYLVGVRADGRWELVLKQGENQHV